MSRPTRLIAPAALLAAALVLAGCGGSSEPPPTEGRPDATAAATRADLSLPTPPAAMDTADANGAAVFATYAFEVLSYGYVTGSTADFDALTDPGCISCDSLSAAAAEWPAGGWELTSGELVIGHVFGTQQRDNGDWEVDAIIAGGTMNFARGEHETTIQTWNDEYQRLVVRTVGPGEWSLVEIEDLEMDFRDTEGNPITPPEGWYRTEEPAG